MYISYYNNSNSHKNKNSILNDDLKREAKQSYLIT